MTARRAAAGPHLFLVGMMGSGKSTVGRRCAERLGRPFVDLDASIEERAGRPVAAIFGESGEGAFRRIESEALAEAAASPRPAVVACGGGAVLAPGNRDVMTGAGAVVWLRVPASVAAGRLGTGAGRPLLESSPAGVEGTLTRLAAERDAAYRAAADAEIDASAGDPDAVASAVLEAYRSGAGVTP